MLSSALPFDYHSHHWRCRHAEGDLADYVEAARAQNLTEFGVSDHAPAYFFEGDDPTPTTCMPKSELPAYVREARALQARYAGQITVKVGVEADFVPGSEHVYRDVLAEQNFDYVLGSVHWVNGRSVFDRSRWHSERAEDTYAAYYDLVICAAESGLFDVLSHLTVVEAYGPKMPDDVRARLYPPVAEAVAASGCIVEVNTSGYRKMGGDDPFPNRDMLQLLIAAGVPLTFGSDCHRIGEVGHGRERVAALLCDLGMDVGRPHSHAVLRGPLLVVNKNGAGQ